MNYKFLITGGAGFIGFHLAKKLSDLNYEIIIIDNLNDYYDPQLKISRLTELGFSKSKILDNKLVKSNKYSNLLFQKFDIIYKKNLDEFVKKNNINYIIHLAAQAGVRYSIENPQAYIDSNITGFLNILEVCKDNKIQNLVYASSSSVYGNNQNVPFSINDRVDLPASLYAITKKTNELMAYTYKQLYNINSIGVRFFTVYGPWGRPDMAYYNFTKSAFEGNEIQVYNHGKLSRDFTFIDDVINGLEKIIKRVSDSSDLCEIFNIGNNKPTELKKFISLIEKETGKIINKKNIPMQLGDVYNTHADIEESVSILDYYPKTNIEIGLKKFIEWYKKYYKIENGL